MPHSTPVASSREQAYGYVRNAVFTRILIPGSRIDPDRMAEQAKASPAAMREALTDLAEEGWLEAPLPEVFTVKPVTADNIKEEARRRLALEFQIIERAMPRLTRKQFGYLDALVSQHRRAGLAQCHAGELFSLDRTFHLFLASLAGVPHLVDSLQAVMEISLRVGLDPRLVHERFPSCLREHETIVNALRDADCAAAKRAMRLHIGNAYSAMLRSVGDE